MRRGLRTAHSAQDLQYINLDATLCSKYCKIIRAYKLLSIKRYRMRDKDI